MPFTEPMSVVTLSTEELSISSIGSLNDLTPQLQAEWDGLVRHAPMRSSTWMLSWWKVHATSRRRLSLLFIRDRQGTLCGLAPLYTDVYIQGEVWRWLGSGVACTDHTTWYSRDGYQSAVGEAVAKYLMNESVDGRWKRLHWSPVEADDQALQSTLTTLAGAGYLIHRRPDVSCWKLALPASWDEYLERLSKSHRKRCRRLYRTYFESGRVHIHEANGPLTFRAGWEIFLKLHEMRWGDSRRRRGAFEDSTFRQFHELLAPQLLNQGQLRLAWLECDGEPVAAEYQFQDDTTLYAYQSGMNPDFAQFQPGNLSIMASIHYAISRGLTTLDLMRGDEPYKAHWRAEPQACEEIRVWPDDWKGRCAYGMIEARDTAARFWHQTFRSSPGMFAADERVEVEATS